MTQVKNLYSDRANERRKQFNNIINGIDMVLMNNIVEVDENIYWSFDGESPMTPEDCNWDSAGDKMICRTHDFEMLMTDEDWDDDETDLHCDYAEEELSEVYQWFAVGSNDADFLKRHGQYIAYSEVLDTHFLAICHFGTAWDYVDSMVEAFSDCYVGLEDFSDRKDK